MSDPSVDSSSLPLSRRWAWIFALGVPAVLLLARLGASGIWDPYELNAADLARRVAVNVFGASSLALEGTENGMPKLGDLGHNDLSTLSIALGFKLFGLHEWAGRLPLALWGLAGVCATYLGLARLIDRRAGVYGALVLATMPLYFLQARTMLGDVVTMACVAIAFFGLAVAAFGTAAPGEPAGRATRVRAGALALGLLGLAGGFDSRGALIGVALPALGVGLAWAVAWASGQRRADRLGDVAGALALVAGAASAWLGTDALFHTTSSEYSMLVGAQIATPSKFPTFDYVILFLGHSLFPWSAFVPFALGRLFREPTFAAADAEGAAASPDRAVAARESVTRLALIVGAAVAFGVHAVMAPRTGHLAFAGPALLAGIAAVAIRDFERGAPASRALAVGVAILAGIYLRDYSTFPDKGLSAFAVSGASFPESFKDQATTIIRISTVVFVAITFFAWMERDARTWFRFRDEYLAWPRSLQKAWDGNLLWGLVALEAGLVLVALGVAIGLWGLHAKQVVQMGVQVRVILLNAFWIAPIALVVPVWATMLARDAFRWSLAHARLSRGEATVGAGLIVGALLGLRYYPALAAQLSPKDVFEAYGHMHASGDSLALLGVNSRSANYYAGSEVKTLADVPGAFAWLQTPGARRWIVLRNEDLPRLNSLWRTRPGPRTNLPVLDARSSQILLASSQLGAGETNQNPLDAIVLDAAPSVANRVEVNLEDKLENLGWEVWDLSGKERVDSVVPGRKYRFRTYWKALAPVTQEWETFIHIDGFQRRFNGDHKTTGGKYPFHLWQVGDVVVDDYEFSLEPNFTPGRYNVFYGLFSGDNRMKVKTGRHDDNRIDGGGIVVK